MYVKLKFVLPFLKLLSMFCQGEHAPANNVTNDTHLLSMPLINNVNAVMVAQLDVNAVNKELKVYIDQQIQIGIESAMKAMASEIVNRKVGDVTKELESNFQQTISETSNVILDKVSTNYVQWGRNSCTSANTDTVYSGFVGGSAHTTSGSAVEYVCMVYDPQWGINDTEVNNHPFIGGALVDIYDINVPNAPFDVNKNDRHGVACAVCKKKQRTSTIMIPARQDCYDNWTKEYDGYLFSGDHTHASGSEYICLDNTPDALNKSSTWIDKSLLYSVRINCNDAIPCLPYVNGRKVTCVVCSF